MMKILILILFPFFVQGQHTMYLIVYDPGGQNDTVYTKPDSDTLYRLVNGQYVAGQSTRTKRLLPWANIQDKPTIPSQTAIDAALLGKQNTLVSAVNIKTVNGNTLVGVGDVSISSSVAWGGVTGTLSSQTDLNNALNGKLSTNGSAANLTSFPTLNQNTSGTAAGLSAVLSFANGGISVSAATSATTGTMTVPMTSSMITITPTGACTFNATGGVAGQIVTFLITTSGVTSFVLTFGTNFRKAGTLSTGTVSARFFSVTFRCINGTIWQEIGRTGAQT